MAYVQTKIYHGECDVQISLGSLDTNRSPDPEQKKKKRTCSLVEFTVHADDRLKIKESEKRDTYLDPARKPRKL